MAMPINPVNRLADCNYGGHLVSAAIISDRITGCQFHPEKSGEVGLKILRKFCAD
jgi:glutamine amidotransferase